MNRICHCIELLDSAHPLSSSRSLYAKRSSACTSFVFHSHSVHKLIMTVKAKYDSQSNEMQAEYWQLTGCGISFVKIKGLEMAGRIICATESRPASRVKSIRELFWVPALSCIENVF